MSKDPAFLFYSADFQIGTEDMTDAQVGKYIRLMCRQHLKGHITEEHMLKICGTYDKDIYSKFVQDEDGSFYNERLEEEIVRRKKYSQSRAANRSGKAKEPKKPKVKRKPKYASIPDCDFVCLTENEIGKVKEKWGDKKALKMFELLDDWLGKCTELAIKARNKDHYGYFRKDGWLSNRAEEELSKTNRKSIAEILAEREQENG
jgi:uncharacterized protein YdaU (DUF1376 family)